MLATHPPIALVRRLSAPVVPALSSVPSPDVRLLREDLRRVDSYSTELELLSATLRAEAAHLELLAMHSACGLMTAVACLEDLSAYVRLASLRMDLMGHAMAAGALHS